MTPAMETPVLLETEAPESTHESTPAPAVPELSQLLILLLKGVLYRQDDEALWGSLLRLQARVREQAAVLLLDLVLDEAEGYAFLQSRPEVDAADAASQTKLPRLIARRPLSYPVSLMLALLRKRMAEADAGAGDTRLVLARADLLELVRVFLADSTNEVRLETQVDATINKVVELGFLRKLKPVAGASQQGQQHARFEVQRILKAFVDAQWLAEFDARLQTYRAHADARATEPDSEDSNNEDSAP